MGLLVGFTKLIYAGTIENVAETFQLFSNPGVKHFSKRLDSVVPICESHSILLIFLFI